jgi:ubiquinone/menaquinone biosynthesis C-methylase UbiE
MTDLLPQTDFQMAPCLAEGPIAGAAREAVQAARHLGRNSCASLLRAWCVPFLFNGMDQAFRSDREPVRAINELLAKLAAFLNAAAETGFAGLAAPLAAAADESAVSADTVEEITGKHYGHLFKDFSDESYWREPVGLLRTRLERNGVPMAGLEGKTVLDAGCGGGRYTAAWRLLGAAHATGVDLSDLNIATARERAARAAIEGLTFEQANVLRLPFAGNRFDIVFSNGVLHHSVDWRQGVAELLRVLKPGGLGWLYLIDPPGGLFWDVIEILRVVMKTESKETARAALRVLQHPESRIFYQLDHVMAPINLRIPSEEIEAQLAAAGATGIRRLARGHDLDRIEELHRDAPYAAIKYGAGENRYIFSK